MSFSELASFALKIGGFATKGYRFVTIDAGPSTGMPIGGVSPCRRQTASL
jgi:hypothetical protein